MLVFGRVIAVMSLSIGEWFGESRVVHEFIGLQIVRLGAEGGG